VNVPIHKQLFPYKYKVHSGQLSDTSEFYKNRSVGKLIKADIEKMSKDNIIFFHYFNRLPQLKFVTAFNYNLTILTI